MKHPVDVHVGKRVRHRRWMLGVTQQQLAEQVGIKFQQIQKYETGMNRISASRLWDIAEALDAPVSFFFEGIDGQADARRRARRPDVGQGSAGAGAQLLRDPRDAAQTAVRSGPRAVGRGLIRPAGSAGRVRAPVPVASVRALPTLTGCPLVAETPKPAATLARRFPRYLRRGRLRRGDQGERRQSRSESEIEALVACAHAMADAARAAALPHFRRAKDSTPTTSWRRGLRSGYRRRPRLGSGDAGGAGRAAARGRDARRGTGGAGRHFGPDLGDRPDRRHPRLSHRHPGLGGADRPARRRRARFTA